ncbi:MAG TPA: ABC transporter permease [Longimicrobiales bacterium]
MEAILQDFRYGARRLLRSPGFSALVIITLALGIGANTAIFSVVNALLLRPLPYTNPGQLVTIEHVYPSLDDLHAPVSAQGFKVYRDETKSFTGVAVQTGGGVNLTGIGEPERLVGSRVSAQYFSTYGAQPAMGRVFLPEEDQPGAAKVAVLSDELWRRRFGADPAILQKTLTLNGEPYQVIGVMPAGYRDFFNRRTEIWTPVALTPEQYQSGNEFLPLTARLAPGISLAAAQTEMTQVANRIKAENPDAYPPNWTLTVTSLTEKATGNVRTPLLILLGSVGMVLLIACANVANLLLARAAGRLKEVSVRLAMGAKRWQLIRQLLSESMLLGLLGGLAGLGIAYAGVKLLVRFAPPQLDVLDTVTIDSKVMIFTLLVSVVTGFVFGLAPALQSTRANVSDTLREGGRGAIADRSGHALRRVFVVAELALALTLLAGAGLLIRSYERLSSVDPGFNTENLLTFNLALPGARYTNDTTRIQFFDRVLSAMSNSPGVRGVAAVSTMPFTGGWSTSSFTVEGYTVPENQPGPWGDIRIVNEDYASAMGIPVTRGRFFNANDRADGQPVAVVDEELVRRYWPDTDPIGKRITFDDVADSTAQWINVIGVVGHTSQEGLDAEKRVQVYFSYRQNVTPFMQIGVRTAGDPMAIVPSIRQAVKSVDAELPLANLNTMEQLVAESIGPRRLSTSLLGFFSGLALLLAALGIYGVIAHSVMQRTQELGVRMALGAGAKDVLRLVMMQGLAIAGIGLTVGIGGAFALTRLMKSQLYQVDATDPVTFISVAAILLAVALLATLLPALRAMRLDPVQALRQE